MSVLNRLTADIAVLLNSRGLFKESIRIGKCYGYQHCHQSYCIRCMSRRAYRQREHLKQSLPALLKQHPRSQVWFLTGATEDSEDVRTHSQAANRGMNRLLKHDRLKDRVIGHFSALEVEFKRFRPHPCAHVHTLLVTKPLDKGRYRISERDWILMWEEVCPLARKRDLSAPLKPRLPRTQKKHASFVAIKADSTPNDLDNLIRYCTKWATPKDIASDYRLLLKDPDKFIHHFDSLKGVKRFFGPLNRTAPR